jgi:SsrA-binding protein
MHIGEYMDIQSDPLRTRKLLLHKTELKRLAIAKNSDGCTIIPLVLKLTNKGFAKLDIAIARGKSKVDKRQLIKKRDQERDLRKKYKT